MLLKGSLVHAVDTLVGDYLRIAPDEDVVVTADTGSDGHLIEALLDGIRRRGARPTAVLIPKLPYQGGLADGHIPAACGRAVERADVWIDATFPYMAGSAIHDALLQKGRTRYLLLGDPSSESFVRLFGDIDFDLYHEAQTAFDDVFGRALGKICRITCPRGTDVSFKLARSGLKKPRRATEPGMYVVPGSCSIAPDIETVEGRIVIGAVFHTFYEALGDPIEIEVRGGIKGIRGAGASAIAFEKAVRRAVSDGMGSVIHFTHGLSPAARVTGRSFVEDMRAIGNNAVGFGIPWWEPGGGENHPDGVVLGHSVWIEDQQVIDRGRIVWPEDLRQKADKLTSR